MNIDELRKKTGLSQRQFSQRYKIPIGTVRNWEQGISNPPSYLTKLLEMEVNNSNMINIETMYLMKTLDDLAKLTENGIDNFENATEENRYNKVFYDAETEDENGNFKIALDMCLISDPGCVHHDVVSHYDDETDEYSIRVVTAKNDNDQPYILVKFEGSNREIVIEDGRWYFT